MKVLVIGSGGREHALVWKLRQSPSVTHLYCVPGNGGIAGEAACIAADLKDNSAIVALAESLRADLTVVGPEGPLAGGIADAFEACGLAVAGPSQAAARLEGSKVFAKEFMRRHGIPTADFVVCDNIPAGRANLGRWSAPPVVKADGLAAGKGVVVASDRREAEEALEAMLSGRLFGEAGHRVVLEERLQGEEISFLVLTDGKTILPLAPTQDHKRAWDDDRGPNTGGMGAYCDDRIVSPKLSQRILNEIVAPTLAGMRSEDADYKGVLYCGLMITSDGPKVIEYNVRFGDPETQPVMLRMEGDLAETLLALAQGRLGPDMISWKPGASVCVVACSAGYPGDYSIGKTITGIDDAEANGAKVFHAGTSIENGMLTTAGGRVLGISAVGPDLEAATAKAYEAASRIRFDGIYYRRDIGRKGLQRVRPL